MFYKESGKVLLKHVTAEKSVVLLGMFFILLLVCSFQGEGALIRISTVLRADLYRSIS